MKQYAWAFLFCLVSINLAAQERFVTISGKIIDASTEEPLPFASVYVKESSLGTTSNTEGEFVFHIPEELKDNKVVVSMLGYTTLEKSPSTFANGEVIELAENSVTLEEVVVSAERSLTAKQIVRRAYNSLEKNYPTEPYLLEGFVRDLQKEDSTYVELMEYAVRMKYQPYNATTEPKVELQAVRRSFIAEKHPWNDERERQNAIFDLIEDEFIRFNYGPIRAKRGWEYEMEQVLPFQNRYVYKIKGRNKPFETALLYIDTETFAFVRMELTRSAHRGRSWKRRLTNGLQQMHYRVIFEYQEYQGKWYLKYQKEEDTWQVYDGLESKKLLFTKYPKKELFVNKILTESLETSYFTANLLINRSIESQAKPYDPKFWEHYNAPTKTKELSTIEAYLKKAQIRIE
ncbi:MAG: carboxypeptidase-like regulatory domain-containing protein [Cyclobacteriaceae bacterium]